jgi:arylsulfatase A-like enzyme
MRFLLKIVSSLFFSLCILTSVRGEDKGPLNILFISVDDLNTWVGCYGGHPDVKTPSMDKLAAEGVLFTQNHCAAPECNPSRTAMLTGLRPSTSGVYNNDQAWRTAMPKAVTMMKQFKDHGYEVFGAGKIFHASGLIEGYDDKPSWTEYVAGAKGASNETESKQEEKGERVKGGVGKIKWESTSQGDEERLDGRNVRWAAQQLAKKHDKPFFLAVGIAKPHLPWTVPKKYFDMYPPDKVNLPVIKEDDLNDIPEAGRKIAIAGGEHKKILEANKYHDAVAAYLAAISFSDSCVGFLMDALKQSEYSKNTIIVLWSDHGWHLGEKSHWKKFSLWEEATRCPLIVIVPGITSAGGKCDRTVNLMDIGPTLFELCGVPSTEKHEGHSFVKLLKDPQAAWDFPSVTTFGKGNHSVRSEKWRYIRYADGSEELYDHEKDSHEWENLAGKAEFSDVKKDLARYLPRVNADDVPKKGASDE